jgi:DNA-binding transcriptional LysR family regulator
VLEIRKLHRRHVDSEALQTFVAVHRTGGFSAAAEELRRSQPAISRRISLLEQQLGGPLFERTAAGVRLSQLGETLMPHAVRVLAALDDARQAVRDLRELKAGPVKLAVVGTLAGPMLTGVLRRFTAEAPDVALSLRTATSRQVSELVQASEATIGLRYFRDAASDLECLEMAAEQLVVVCAPEHPLASGRVAAFASLASEIWLAFPRRNEVGEVVAETLFAEFLGRGIADFRWSAVDSLTAQKRLAEAGFGLALLPISSVEEELKAGSLARIEVADLDATNPVFAVVRRGAYLSKAARRLLEMLIDEGRVFPPRPVVAWSSGA